MRSALPDWAGASGATPDPAGRRDARAMAILGTIAGVLAFAAIVVAHEAETRYAATVWLAGAGLLFLPLIGNVRLLCLYVMLTLAPLKVRVSFLNFPHMGGAGGLFLDAIDPFMLLLLYFQLRDRVRGLRAEYRFPRAFVFWAAMMVLGLGAVILGSLRTLSALELVRMGKLLLLGLLVVNEVRRLPQFRHVVIALTLGVIAQSVIALAEYAVGGTLGLEVLGEASEEDIKNLSAATLSTGDFVNRVGALLGHANLLACYLALFLPMAVALVLAPVSGRLKIVLATALVVGQPALVLTLSRTGWIDFMVGFAMVLALGALHPESRRKYLVARIVIVAVTVTVALSLSPHIIKRLLETDPSAVEMRLEWLQTARNMIIDNPVFGVGLNTYVFRQLPYGKDKTPEDMSDRYGDIEVWPAVHNSWMLTWTEQGTVGFLLWIAFHFAVLAEAWKNLRIRDPMMHALNVGLMAGFVGVMIDGLASFFVRTEAPARMFWIATAVILAIGYWKRENEPADAPGARMPTDPVTPAPALAPAPADDAEAKGGRWLPNRSRFLP